MTEQAVAELESGLMLPSISKLYRLARAFNVSPGALLPSVEVRPRMDVHLPLTDEPGASAVRVFCSGAGTTTQIYLFDLHAGESDGGFDQHAGEELLVVVSGSVVCSVHGHDDVTVHEGDSRQINTRVPHGVRAEASGPARFLLICDDPDPNA